MNQPKPSFTVPVDVTNPGQFFACCGLLELADRLWPGAEGWFDEPPGTFSVYSDTGHATLNQLVDTLAGCSIEGLTREERDERDQLEAEKRRLKKQDRELPKEKEQRRLQLGTKAREGRVFLGPPFELELNWWQTRDEDPATPKTWAGRQETHRIARAAQGSMAQVSDQEGQEGIFGYGQVMRLPCEYRKCPNDAQKAVEPFYFDARRFVHPLDVGFSLDVHDAETAAHPAVELLCLIGLQRFRPAPTSAKGRFEYWAWGHPLTVAVASAVVSGAASAHRGHCYRYELRFRDDQRRYKAFGYATLIGG